MRTKIATARKDAWSAWVGGRGVAGRYNRAIVDINDGTFYRTFPYSHGVSSTSPIVPLFPNLNFRLSASSNETTSQRRWAVIGRNPTPFLDVLRGEYICVPPIARTNPYLSDPEVAAQDYDLRIPSRAIQYVGFNTGSASTTGAPGGVRGAYLSARYESRREETDWSVSQYLRGQTELNPSKHNLSKSWDEELFSEVVRNLRMSKLLDMPVSNLSNGQTRRSRIAKALLRRPLALLLDEPFMGLDPPTLVSLSHMLQRLAVDESPVLVLGLRPQDPIPDWITDLVILGENNTIPMMGKREAVLYAMYCWHKALVSGYDGMAETLNNAFGPPPFGKSSHLTPQGVADFSAVESAWHHMHGASRGNLDEFPVDTLGFTQQRRFEEARLVPAAERTPWDWLDLTALLSREAFQILQGPRLLSPDLHVRQTQTHQSQKTHDTDPVTTPSDPLIEVSSIVVKYGAKVVLGHPPPQHGFSEPGVNLTVSRGSRLLLLGPNGSGKTTLLSLLTSDHPQSYSLPIKFFGRTRLPEPGIPGLSLWEIQSRIGHSSPEVNAFFPKHLTIRQVLESAWAETFSSKPELTPERHALVDLFLRTWSQELKQLPISVDEAADDLSWASEKNTHPRFGRLPFGTQRLLLLLRAIIKQPDIIILDEAFSGLDTNTRDKALSWLEKGQHATDDTKEILFPGLTDQQALVVVSHVREEVPDCINEYVRLPSEEEAIEDGRTVEVGRSKDGYITSAEGWNKVWDL